TDNGAADSGKKKDNMPGDDMSRRKTKKDDSVTGDGMMGDDMDGDGENTTRSVDRRNAAASASDRSRYFGSDKTITHENGNLYGKTYLNPETEKSANAQLRSNGRSLTGTNINGISNDVRYRQMLSNGRVHDTDGFLFDGEIISFLGGSRVQIAGPTAAFATIVAGIVAKNGMDGLIIATL
ncbi:hypothetical protein OBE_11476, partial [human gut metagenome]